MQRGFVRLIFSKKYVASVCIISFLGYSMFFHFSDITEKLQALTLYLCLVASFDYIFYKLNLKSLILDGLRFSIYFLPLVLFSNQIKTNISLLELTIAFFITFLGDIFIGYISRISNRETV